MWNIWRAIVVVLRAFQAGELRKAESVNCTRCQVRSKFKWLISFFLFFFSFQISLELIVCFCSVVCRKRRWNESKEQRTMITNGFEMPDCCIERLDWPEEHQLAHRVHAHLNHSFHCPYCNIPLVDLAAVYRHLGANECRVETNNTYCVICNNFLQNNELNDIAKWVRWCIHVRQCLENHPELLWRSRSDSYKAKKLHWSFIENIRCKIVATRIVQRILSFPLNLLALNEYDRQ